MLPWSDVKPLIREIVAPVFVDMGFLTPGICMWRHREKFIDVVEFRGHRVGQILVSLGARRDCLPYLRHDRRNAISGHSRRLGWRSIPIF